MARRAARDAALDASRSDCLGGLTPDLLDTSVILAGAGDFASPGVGAVSVVTLGELQAGVMRTRSAQLRGEREARLAWIRSAYEPVPVDEAVADAYGRALAHARDRGTIEDASDLLILATAWTADRVLLTRDVAQGRLAKSLGVAVQILS